LLYTFADISFLLPYEQSQSFDNHSYCRLTSQNSISAGSGEKKPQQKSFSNSTQCACQLPHQKPLAGDDDCLSCSLFLTADSDIDYPAPATFNKFTSTFIEEFLQPDSPPKSFFRPPRRV
jgi:hypothetical protein